MPMRRLLFAAILLVTGCLGGGGSGSETTVAGVAGRVVDAQGNALERVAVHVRPEAAFSSGRLGIGVGAEEPPAAFTKADGSFLVEGLAAGNYYVECRASEGAALLQASVKDTLVRLPDAVVRPTGALRGRIAGYADPDTGLYGAFVYIPGLSGETFGESIRGDTLSFLLKDIPAGTYTVRVQPGYPVDLSRFKLLDIPEVRVEAGDTADLGFFRLPKRAGIQDSAYVRDSLAVAALLRANGMDERSVPMHTGVSGDRITMLVERGGAFSRMTPDLEALDQVDFVNFMGDESVAQHDLDASGIERLRGLKTLQLWWYHLVGDLEWLKGLRDLEILSIGGTGLKTFPAGIEELSSLQWLNLDGDTIGSLPGTVKRLRHLRTLALGRTGLTALPAEMGELRSLQGLNLSSNGFTAIPAAVLALDSLRDLDMSDNQLTSLPREMMAMPALRGFNARGNRLCGLSQEWKDWLKRQDSLWYSHVDTSLFKFPKGTLDSGWEAGQRCGSP